MTTEASDPGVLPTAAKAAIGIKISAEDVVSAPPVAAMLATLNRSGRLPRTGDEIPALWHGLFCTAKLRPAALGPDGMARDEPMLPYIPGYPRRRFGGARFDFARPIRIGQNIRRVSEIATIVKKSGRSGDFLRALVRHVIEGPEGPSTIEENDVLFLSPAAGRQQSIRAAASESPPGHAVWSCSIEPDPVLLFRHSALTFNAHRVHYDRDYAKAQGEPGLLVQGILIARLMLEMVHAERPEQQIASFSFRAGAPVHDTTSFTIAGEPAADGSSAILWATRADGRIAMTATVGFGVAA